MKQSDPGLHLDEDKGKNGMVCVGGACTSCCNNALNGSLSMGSRYRFDLSSVLYWFYCPAVQGKVIEQGRAHRNMLVVV